MTFNKNGFGYGVAYYSGAMVIGTVSVVGRLLVGLLMLVGKKTIIEGGPRIMASGHFIRLECTESVRKYRAKLMQKISDESRRNPPTPEIGDVVNPNNL